MKRKGEIAIEIEKFYEAVRARALLIAIEWAGSAGALAEIAGYDKYTGRKWGQRGKLSAHAALRLTKVKGFPLKLDEMCPGIQVDRYVNRDCPHCGRSIFPQNGRTGCSPLLKVGRRRAKKRRLALLKTKAAKGSTSQE